MANTWTFIGTGTTGNVFFTRGPAAGNTCSSGTAALALPSADSYSVGTIAVVTVLSPFGVTCSDRYRFQVTAAAPPQPFFPPFFH